MPTTTRIAPENVLDALGRHMLVDGYHVVMDLDRSRGSVIYDSLRGVEVLDLYSHFATVPVGYNHPRMQDPEFRRKYIHKIPDGVELPFPIDMVDSEHRQAALRH